MHMPLQLLVSLLNGSDPNSLMGYLNRENHGMQCEFSRKYVLVVEGSHTPTLISYWRGGKAPIV